MQNHQFQIQENWKLRLPKQRICVLSFFEKEDGSVTIPEVLKPYMK